jgi:hypothetical protein
MRRLAWLAGLALVSGACGEPAAEVPLPTYTGSVESGDAFFVQGTLELREGCLAVAVDEDGETVRAMLRLPSDAGAELEWKGSRLWFHKTPYDLGSTVVFRATAGDVADVEDVPEMCRDTGLEHVVTALPEATDLALDPSATVIGGGDQLRVPVAELSNGGMDAALRGDLAVVGGRCLGVEHRGGTDTLLIWPFGTSVSYHPDPVVMLPNGTTYAVGDRLDLGGGFVHESDTAGTPAPAPIEELPEECQGLSRFLVSPF